MEKLTYTFKIDYLFKCDIIYILPLFIYFITMRNMNTKNYRSIKSNDTDNS